MARQRLANMTPEQKEALYDRKKNWFKRPENRLRRNAEAVVKRTTWTPERLEQQKKSQKEFYEKLQLRSAQGLCGYSPNCNEPPVGVQRFCLYHWCRGVLMAHGKRVSCAAEDLISLWNKQGGKCAITKVKIIPGDTAELDHIVSIYSGGNGSIENLRYVHGAFNRFKSHMTDPEVQALILELCPNLIEWAKK